MDNQNASKNPETPSSPQLGENPTPDESSGSEQQPPEGADPATTDEKVTVGGGNPPPDLSAPEPPESETEDGETEDSEESPEQSDDDTSGQGTADQNPPADKPTEETSEEVSASDDATPQSETKSTDSNLHHDYAAARQRLAQAKSKEPFIGILDSESVESNVEQLLAKVERLLQAQRFEGEEKQQLQSQLAQAKDHASQLQENLNQALQNNQADRDFEERLGQLGDALEEHFDLRGRLGRAETERDQALTELEQVRQRLRQQSAPTLTAHATRIVPWALAAILGGAMLAQWFSGTPETAGLQSSSTAEAADGQSSSQQASHFDFPPVQTFTYEPTTND